jgi:hypothetical protein
MISIATDKSDINSSACHAIALADRASQSYLITAVAGLLASWESVKTRLGQNKI